MSLPTAENHGRCVMTGMASTLRLSLICLGLALAASCASSVATPPASPGDTNLRTDEGTLLHVDDATVLIATSFPAQVSVQVKGSLPDPCAAVGTVTQRRDGNKVIVSIPVRRGMESVRKSSRGQQCRCASKAVSNPAATSSSSTAWNGHSKSEQVANDLGRELSRDGSDGCAGLCRLSGWVRVLEMKRFVATRREGRQNPVRPYLARWFTHGASLRRRVNASMNLARTRVKVYLSLSQKQGDRPKTEGSPRRVQLFSLDAT